MGKQEELFQIRYQLNLIEDRREALQRHLREILSVGTVVTVQNAKRRGEVFDNQIRNNKVIIRPLPDSLEWESVGQVVAVREFELLYAVPLCDITVD